MFFFLVMWFLSFVNLVMFILVSVSVSVSVSVVLDVMFFFSFVVYVGSFEVVNDNVNEGSVISVEK